MNAPEICRACGVVCACGADGGTLPLHTFLKIDFYGDTAQDPAADAQSDFSGQYAGKYASR
jgi:hypothetical protein